jgi:hypothetical protein
MILQHHCCSLVLELSLGDREKQEYRQSFHAFMIPLKTDDNYMNFKRLIGHQR